MFNRLDKSDCGAKKTVLPKLDDGGDRTFSNQFIDKYSNLSINIAMVEPTIEFSRRR
jgi:hypothetical protein